MYIGKDGTLVRATIVTGYNSEKCDWEIDFMNGKTIIMPDKDFREQYSEAMICPDKECYKHSLPRCKYGKPHICNNICEVNGGDKCPKCISYIPEQKEPPSIGGILYNPPVIEQSNLMLSDEEILNYWDFSIDQPKHLFLSAGRAVAQAELDHLKGLGIVYVKVSCDECRDFSYNEYCGHCGGYRVLNIPLSYYKGEK